MILDIFLLLILFQFKHFIADYPLQTQYMLGKMSKESWIAPLISHVLVHGVFTYLIVIVFTQSLWLAIILTILDMTIHFTMDRIKASPYKLGRFKPEQPYFWWALGFDQMIHHLTHYLLIYIVITH